MVRKTMRRNKRSMRNRKNRKSVGGTRKAKGPMEWSKFVKRTYEEMKSKNANVTFKDAMMEASRRKKNGQF
jgi:hypothetical protein